MLLNDLIRAADNAQRDCKVPHLQALLSPESLYLCAFCAERRLFIECLRDCLGENPHSEQPDSNANSSTLLYLLRFVVRGDCHVKV